MSNAWTCVLTTGVQSNEDYNRYSKYLFTIYNVLSKLSASRKGWKLLIIILVTGIKEKIEERHQLRWNGHVKQRPLDHMVKEAMNITLTQQKQKGRPKNNWIRRTI